MSRSDLLALLDREAQSLGDENNHSAAALMRAAAAEIRSMTGSMVIHCSKPLSPEMIERLRASFKDGDLRAS